MDDKRRSAVIHSLNSEPRNLGHMLKVRESTVKRFVHWKSQDGHLVSNDKEVADELNHFFHYVFVGERDAKTVETEIS